VSTVRSIRFARIGATPQFARAIRLVAWAWIALGAVTAVAFTIMVAYLPGATWYVFPAERDNSPQLLLVATDHLMIAAWGVVLVAVAIGAMVLVVRGSAAIWLPAILIVVAFLTAICTTELLGSVIPQLGHTTVMPRSTAGSTLVTPVSVITSVTAASAALTLLVIPYLAGRKAADQVIRKKSSARSRR
jgi:hypothetical protein